MGDTFIHPTAVIDPPASIGAGSKIWHFCHVMAGAQLGEGCNLGQNVFVAGSVRLGRNCKIQNNVSLYDGIELGDDVFCGPSMVFTNIKNPRSAIVRKGQYERTVVEQGASLGANCTIVCGVRIGRYALVGAGAVVTADVAPFALMAGVPARQVGWVGRAGYRLDPVHGEFGVWRCPGTSERYFLRDGHEMLPEAELTAAEAEAVKAAQAAPPAEPTVPAPVPLLDLKAQHATMREEIRAALDRVVDSQTFILGPEVKDFEQEAAAYLQGGEGSGQDRDEGGGELHALGCASGSDALLLALMALELPPGSEVITTPYTFFATVSAITRLGLRPVFCDIDPRSYNLDVARLERLITPRTRVLLPVHLFGQCPPMEPIMALAEKHGLAVVEDAAQAMGARDERGRMAGTIGAIGCFSFFPSKNLGGYGDGGLLTTRDAALAARLASLRTHGAAQRYLHESVGVNSRLDALQAAVLRVKLPRLEGWCAARAAHAERYRTLFSEAGLLQKSGDRPAPGRVIAPETFVGRHVYNQFVIRVAAEARDGLRAHLEARRIGTAVYYPLPLHLQPCFKDLDYAEGSLPEAERASRETLALPVFPELTESQQRRVVDEIAAYLRQAQ